MIRRINCPALASDINEDTCKYCFRDRCKHNRNTSIPGKRGIPFEGHVHEPTKDDIDALLMTGDQIIHTKNGKDHILKPSYPELLEQLTALQAKLNALTVDDNIGKKNYLDSMVTIKALTMKIDYIIEELKKR